MKQPYLDVTEAAGATLFRRNIEGEVVMLNLLRFREMADYSQHPEIAPKEPVSGYDAYMAYIEHTRPFLEESGGSILLLGEGGQYLIGPQDEPWDFVMLIRQRSLGDFMAFANNPAYMAGIGHRTAALEDSRLLPIVPVSGKR